MLNRSCPHFPNWSCTCAKLDIPLNAKLLIHPNAKSVLHPIAKLVFYPNAKLAVHLNVKLIWGLNAKSGGGLKVLSLCNTSPRSTLGWVGVCSKNEVLPKDTNSGIFDTLLRKFRKNLQKSALKSNIRTLVRTDQQNFSSQKSICFYVDS